MNVNPRVSHQVRPANQQHPLQAAFQKIVNKGLIDDWKKIHQEAKRLGKKTPSMVDHRLVDFAKKNGSYDKIRSLVVGFLADEKKAIAARALASLKPPHAGEVYERVAKDKIVDVGSGDGKRLVRYREHFSEVTMVEVEDQAVVDGIPEDWKKVKEMPVGEVFCTTFNSLTQLDAVTRATVLSNDGVHVVPNVKNLIRDGYSVPCDGRFLTSIGSMKFVEDDWGVDHALDYGDYYCGVTSFRQRSLEFKAECKIKVKPPVRKGFVRMRHDVGGVYCSPKYDGVYCQLKGDGGRFVLSGRDGDAVGGTCSEKIDVLLELEKMPNSFVLLRILRYNGFRPHHSLHTLQEFVERVKMRICGKGLIAPEVWKVKDIPLSPPEGVDGVVFRSGEMDYVMNYGTSLDVDFQRKGELEEFLRKRRGARFVHHEGGGPGLNQVSVIAHDSGVFECYWRVRYDKKNEDKPAQWPAKFRLLSVEVYLLGREFDDDPGDEFEMDSEDGYTTGEEAD